MKKVLPKISIIIACYNCEKWINKCISSIENQEDSCEMEVICVDDCSKDNTLYQIESYAKESKLDIKIIKSSKNNGPGISRNMGLKKATGEYITFLDSDDYLSNDFCNKISSVLLNEKIDCLIFDYALVDENGCKIKSGKSIGSPYIKEGIVDKKNAFVYTYGSTCGKIYRRNIIVDNSISFANLFISEDMPFAKSAIACCDKIYYLKKELYNYVQVQNSLMHNKDLDDETNCQKAFGFLKKFLNEAEWEEELLGLELREVLNNSVLILLGKDISNKKICQYINDNYKKEHIQNKYFSKYPVHVKIVSYLAYFKFISALKLIWRYRKWKKEKN